jgi:hypothetical protein
LLLEKNQVEEAQRELLRTQNVFVRDMARLLDGQRYDEPFSSPSVAGAQGESSKPSRTHFLLESQQPLLERSYQISLVR